MSIVEVKNFALSLETYILQRDRVDYRDYRQK